MASITGATSGSSASGSPAVRPSALSSAWATFSTWSNPTDAEMPLMLWAIRMHVSSGSWRSAPSAARSTCSVSPSVSRSSPTSPRKTFTSSSIALMRRYPVMSLFKSVERTSSSPTALWSCCAPLAVSLPPWETLAIAPAICLMPAAC